MNYLQIKPKNKKGFIKNSTILLLAYASAFFPRIIQSLGAPSIINFLHFAIVTLAFGIAISTTKVKNKNQITIFWQLAFGLLLLFVIMTTSALLNGAGVINVILDFLLLSEPFLLLLTVVSVPQSNEVIGKLRYWLIVFALINLLLAIAQAILISLHLLPVYKYSIEDNVQGVFYLSGAGNYVSVSISICVSLYFYIFYNTLPFWIRIIGLVASFYQLLASDSKQILLSFLVGWMFLLVTKYNKPVKLIIYTIVFVLFIFGFLWSIENLDIEQLAAFKLWLDRSDLYGPNGEAVLLKTAGIRTIISHYNSPLNWLFGLGPGHTVSRLGGWVIRDYRSLLAPLGITSHPVTEEMWAIVNGSWLAVSTTMFSPLFSWVGIWGDLGFLGLGAYLYIWYVVWCRLCLEDFSKLMVLTVFVFAFIFTQIEEPGYMLSVTLLIGLRWNEMQYKRSHQRSRYMPTVDQSEIGIN
ncbi:hypothetical protein NIES4075_52180 [Tolypothrix sp. NIES-4075]|uniref:hypothetical protein n=1 Tax=Tolypothrix sp. NIES-4075 TaxID=2005459 RepID=UPI000B5C8CCA|nr:hypothetical protein [Tolypothrix sp. NIES-4075]GAX44201.1 hypothetical protein NIES4075_52180 [Tolypothrix sp. NIES-4075]